MHTTPLQKTFKANEIILRQGDPGSSAYIIEKGRVQILIEQPDGSIQNVGTRGPGTMIGEMALVDNAPRTATVQAIEDGSLLEITQDDFKGRLESADPILRMTAQVILTRYRDTLTRATITGIPKDWEAAEARELGYAGQADAIELIKLANEFKSALQNGDLYLHYQPLIDLQNEGHSLGFEALMRWEHPEKGNISPAVFIPVAENSGLIVDASRWALREACKALRRIEGLSGHDHGLFMSVNFSSHDFASENFVDAVYNTISETDVLPQQVHLEITERLLIGQPEHAKETLEMCRKAGMSIAIDDFGTGYSSLSYLHYFPIDTLKIDQRFVREMQRNEGSMELIKSIVSLGKNMKMKIIAEGVETEEEANILRDIGCDMAQGYFFARPMAEKDVAEYVRNTRNRK